MAQEVPNNRTEPGNSQWIPTALFRPLPYWNIKYQGHYKFQPSAPDIKKSGSQTSPSCPSDKNDINKEMSMEH